MVFIFQVLDNAKVNIDQNLNSFPFYLLVQQKEYYGFANSLITVSNWANFVSLFL